MKREHAQGGGGRGAVRGLGRAFLYLSLSICRGAAGAPRQSPRVGQSPWGRHHHRLRVLRWFPSAPPPRLGCRSLGQAGQKKLVNCEFIISPSFMVANFVLTPVHKKVGVTQFTPLCFTVPRSRSRDPWRRGYPRTRTYALPASSRPGAGVRPLTPAIACSGGSPPRRRPAMGAAR